MAVSTNGHDAAVGKATHALMEAATGPCVKQIEKCQTNNLTACVAATDLCNLGLLEPCAPTPAPCRRPCAPHAASVHACPALLPRYTLTGMNPYDMRVKCAVPPLCYDFSNVGVYLDRPEVKAALGVDAKRKCGRPCRSPALAPPRCRGPPTLQQPRAARALPLARSPARARPLLWQGGPTATTRLRSSSSCRAIG
jgi:hypothetical protein